MKNKFFTNKFLPILSIFLLVLFTFVNFSFGFTEEEQTKINETVTTLVNNSKNNGVTWAIDNSCKVAYFQTDFLYNEKSCKYLVLMYWNYQYVVTFTDGVVTAKSNDSASHELCQYYFDENLELIGAKVSNLSNYNSTSFSGINSYFKSTYTIKNSNGETIQPFFQLAPQEITEVLVEETAKVQIMEQMKTMIVGFLKYLIVLVISLIAFWKGWQFLSTQLKRA